MDLKVIFMGEKNMGITEQLGKYITEANLKTMPSQVINIVKTSVIDTIGVALAGSGEDVGKLITAFAGKLDSSPMAGILGSHIRTSSINAALANGTMAHALDYDDAGGGTQGHPCTILVPVVFAVGEETGATGLEIIEAYVVGAEVWANISRKIPLLHMKGWHPTPVLGTIGAAAAAAKLLKLDIERSINTLGIAASEASGLGQNYGTMTKPLHAGLAARNGVMAAMLAREGLTAARDVLEGQQGLFTAFYGKNYLPEMATCEFPPRKLKLVTRGIDIKKYPTCMGTHRAIDALLDLIIKHDIRASEVDSIDCFVPPRALQILRYNHPKNTSEAKFSMPFAMAATLKHRKIDLEIVTDEEVNNQLINELMQRVTLKVHSDWLDGISKDIRPDVVVIKLKDGREYSKGVDKAKGQATLPLTWEELLAKYRACVSRILTDLSIGRSIELLDNLEETENLTELMDLLSNNRLDLSNK